MLGGGDDASQEDRGKGGREASSEEYTCLKASQ